MKKRKRHPLNVEGDFYVEDGMCIFCYLAPDEAPDVINFDDKSTHCYFKKQPENKEELEQAILACNVSETCAVRYSGNDKTIIKQLGNESCDIYD